MSKKTILFSFFIMFFLLVANSLAVEKATAPIPADGVIEVEGDGYAIYLEWTPGDSAESHDIYLGTDYDAVNNATTSSAEFISNQTRPKYAFMDFDNNTMYYWRIDEVNSTTTIKGDVWSFKTYNDGPIVWYKVDEGRGTNVADSSGNGFDTVMEREKWGLGPDGSDCYANLDDWAKNQVDVPNDVFADINETCTISVWLWQLDPNIAPAGGPQCRLFSGGNLTDPNRAVIFKSEGIGNESEWEPPESWEWFSRVTMGSDDQYNHQGVSWDTATKNYNYTWAFLGRDYYANAVSKWRHLTFVKDNTDYEGNGSLKVYYNGILEEEQHYDNCNKSMADVDEFVLGGYHNDPNWWSRFVGKLDDFRVYNRPLSDVEVKDLVGDYFKKAVDPDPANSATIALESANDFNTIDLEWIAGQDAASHDVYFGTDFDDVNTATTASAEFMGNQVAITYDPALPSEGMYYWRIDEVNDIDVWKGDVWSFKVKVARIDDPVAWYKFDETSDVNVADSSGNGYDTSISGTNSYGWDTEGAVDGCLSNSATWRKTFIQVPMGAFSTMNTQATFTFWVQLTETLGNTGCTTGAWFTGKDANDNYVAHARPWTDDYIDYRVEYRIGSSALIIWDDYGSNTTDDEWHHFAVVFDATTETKGLYFDGELVSSGVINTGDSVANMAAFNIFNYQSDATGGDWWDSFHGKMDDFRIYDRSLVAEEVHMFVGDRFKQAKNPSPENEDEDLALTGTTLSWNAGQGAVSHQVYFSDNYIEIRDADVNSPCYQGQQVETTYDPGTLELMKTYYWRVDETDDDDVLWKGDVWSFSSIEYIMVEDFESYDSNNPITAVWTDKFGLGDMQILLMNDPCLSPVNSMRLRHQVPYSPYYAIANRSFSPAQDWTVNGVRILTIHYYGDEANFTLPMFVTIGDGTTDANVVIADVNTLVEGWQEINVSLPEISAAGVDLNNVSYMEIGLGDGTNLGM
ncbi:MAG: hypothetical protein KAS96_03965, partial [Planctomycetes bacterium]|nr:hypothetical protein [Planctomycetota bacterium]